MIKHLLKFKVNKFILKPTMEMNLTDNRQNNILVNTVNTTTQYTTTKYLYEYKFIKPGKITNQSIALNDKENEIFSIIKDILKKHNKSTVCRVAGGWVRDKLLGRKNDDIDIALDDMSGEQIAKLINDELYPGQEKFGVVSQNNEKSKHLETATMKICGTFIDFVNLRCEKYSETSRVPEIEIGTAQEDAIRRDITINSMFYNINSGLVEDLLKLGIEDLSNGYIRTPLDPFVTFTDDPLRVLRVIRFAVRFQFEIDNNIEAAVRRSEIKNALYKKISNERIAKELSLMLEGNKPQCAIYWLYKQDILDAVLKLPLGIDELEKKQVSEITKSMNFSLVGAYIMEKFVINYNNNEKSGFYNKYLFYKKSQDDNTINFKESQKLFYLSLMVLSYKDYTTKIGKETYRASVLIIRESLKLCNEYVKEISIICDNINYLSDYINNSDQKFDRLTSGRIIRKLKSQYIHKLAICCICYDYINSITNSNEIIEYIDDNHLNMILSKYQRWYDYLETEKLADADTIEPLVKGHEISKILKVSGRHIGMLLESLIEKQIVQPNISYEEAELFLKQKKEELGHESVEATPKKKVKTKTPNK